MKLLKLIVVAGALLTISGVAMATTSEVYIKNQGSVALTTQVRFLPSVISVNQDLVITKNITQFFADLGTGDALYCPVTGCNQGYIVIANGAVSGWLPGVVDSVYIYGVASDSNGNPYPNTFTITATDDNNSCVNVENGAGGAVCDATQSPVFTVQEQPSSIGQHMIGLRGL